MIGGAGAEPLEFPAAGGVLRHPLAGEFSRLNVGQHLCHLRTHMGIDHPGPGAIGAVFGGVGDGAVHAGDAAPVHQIDQQLELVQAFEIGEFRRVTRIDQRVERRAHELRGATTKHHLLAEEIGFRFLLDGGLDQAGATTDGAAIGERQRLRPAARVLVNGEKADIAVATQIVGAQGVAGAGRRHQYNIEIVAGPNKAEMQREAMDEKQRGALLHSGRQIACVDFGKLRVRRRQHDNVGLARGHGIAHNRKAGGPRFVRARAQLARADDDVRHAGVAQVQRMRLALIAVADDGDTLAPNEREIGIGGRVSAHLLLRCIGPAKPASWQSCFLASRGEITWRKHRAFWRPSMKTLDISSLALAAIALLTLPVPAAAGRHKFINFDVPGAGASFPSDINDNNDVTGDYRDLSGVYHSFVRTADGTITTFDPPGAASSGGGAINRNGEIVGSFTDSSSVSHGYLRSADGTITIIDPPGSTGTSAYGLNDRTQLTGGFGDSNGIFHGFLRKQSGRYIVFDPEGSARTFGIGINNDTAVTGVYCPNSLCNPFNGFIRSSDGAITTFSVSGANSTMPRQINSSGAVVGHFSTFDGGQGGFVRTPDGQIATFCAWGSGINKKGWAVGFNRDGFGVYHGCLRAPDGTLSTFDDPSAGTDNAEGTQPTAINAARYVTGFYEDVNHAYHGFIVLPRT